MEREDLTIYNDKPKYMKVYLKHHGPHFSEQLCEFAVSKMTKEVNGEVRKIKYWNKEDVDRLLKENDVKLKNTDCLYDYVYTANMGKADFYGSSIIDERHLALYIKDVIDDVDGYDGIVFNRWCADMRRKGIPIDWKEML